MNLVESKLLAMNHARGWGVGDSRESKSSGAVFRAQDEKEESIRHRVRCVGAAGEAICSICLGDLDGNESVLKKTQNGQWKIKKHFPTQ